MLPDNEIETLASVYELALENNRILKEIYTDISETKLLAQQAVEQIEPLMKSPMLGMLTKFIK